MLGKLKTGLAPAWIWSRDFFTRAGADLGRLAAWAGGSLVGSLQAEKAPYVVTLFVAALGWTALRTSDRLQQTPFVEYRTTHEAVQQKGGARYALVHIRNVTTAHSFDCFRLEFVGPPNAFGAVAANSYFSYRGTVASRARVELAQSANWRWEVKDFMSGADMVLGVPLQGDTRFQVMTRPCDAAPAAEAKGEGAKDGAKSKTPAAPLLLERSLQTFYVEYELALLWIGLLVWLMTLVVLNALRPAPPKPATARRLVAAPRR